eukprot:3005573-Prymnesium_polylepis.1
MPCTHEVQHARASCAARAVQERRTVRKGTADMESAPHTWRTLHVDERRRAVEGLLERCRLVQRAHRRHRLLLGRRAEAGEPERALTRTHHGAVEGWRCLPSTRVPRTLSWNAMTEADWRSTTEEGTGHSPSSVATEYARRSTPPSSTTRSWAPGWTPAWTPTQAPAAPAARAAIG